VLRLCGAHHVDAVDNIGGQLLVPHLNGRVATTKAAELTKAERQRATGHLEKICEDRASR